MPSATRLALHDLFSNTTHRFRITNHVLRFGTMRVNWLHLSDRGDVAVLEFYLAPCDTDPIVWVDGRECLRDVTTPDLQRELRRKKHLDRRHASELSVNEFRIGDYVKMPCGRVLCACLDDDAVRTVWFSKHHHDWYSVVRFFASVRKEYCNTTMSWLPGRVFSDS